jgi:hypothetical protein
MLRSQNHGSFIVAWEQDMISSLQTSPQTRRTSVRDSNGRLRQLQTNGPKPSTRTIVGLAIAAAVTLYFRHRQNGSQPLASAGQRVRTPSRGQFAQGG